MSLKRWVWMEIEGPTQNEREILAMLAEGLTYKEIGKRRGRSPATLEKQIGRLMRDTDCHTRGKLVRYATIEGWVQPPARNAA